MNNKAMAEQHTAKATTLTEFSQYLPRNPEGHLQNGPEEDGVQMPPFSQPIKVQDSSQFTITLPHSADLPSGDNLHSRDGGI